MTKSDAGLPTNTRRGGRHPRKFSRLAFDITQPLLNRQGPHMATLCFNWSTIVKARYAQCSVPKRLYFSPNKQTGGTLIIRVNSSTMAFHMSHITDLILECVNQHFGYKAVDRLKIEQGPLLRDTR